MLVVSALTTATSLSLSITPETSPRYEGTNNSNLSADQLEVELGLVGVNLTDLYKSDGGGLSFSDSYKTKFFNSPNDPSDATISHVDGKPVVTGYTNYYLYVKDGEHQPAFYLFSLADWDGIEDIVLTGFWVEPLKGAISHVTIIGANAPIPNLNTVPTPDGGMTALMLGLGLFGVGLLGRSRFLKA